MENNEGTRDISSESDGSDWAIIDEDSSLEWNDEAKYNFRQPDENTALDQSVEVVSLESPKLCIDDDSSDEDSIEVVSDDANDYLGDRSNENLWCRLSKNDLNNVEPVKHEAINNETHELQDCDVKTDMLWYPLKERNDIKALSIYKPQQEQTTVATDYSQLFASSAFLVVVFVLGVSLGFGFRCLGTISEPNRHHTTVNLTNIVQKLYHENNLLRYKLNTFHPYCFRPLKTTTHFNSSKLTWELNLQQAEIEIPKTKHEFMQLELELTKCSCSSLNNLTFHQHDNLNMNIKDVRHKEQGKIIRINSPVHFLQNENIIHGKEVDSELPIIVEDVEEMLEQEQHTQLPENGIEPNIRITFKNTIANISSIVPSQGRFQQDIENALLSSLELMRKMELNLQFVDSLPIKYPSSRLESKVAKFTLNMNKVSRTLVNKIDKTVHKLSVDILHRLKESKRNMFKKLCEFSNFLNKENILTFELQNGIVFTECKTNKYKSGNRSTPKTILRKKNVSQFLKRSEELVNRDHTTGTNDLNLKRKQAEKITKTNLKNIKQNLVNKEMYVKPKAGKYNVKNKHSSKGPVRLGQIKHLSEDSANNGGNNLGMEPEDKQRNYEAKNQKNLKDGVQTETSENPNKWLNTDHKMSNVSGEWVIKMGEGRQKQRNYEHQSDWLFDRALSRKVYRDKDSIKTSPENHQNQFESNTEKCETIKDEAKKYWKNKKKMLKEIPKTIISAAKLVKNTIKNFAGQNKVRVRQQ